MRRISTGGRDRNGTGRKDPKIVGHATWDTSQKVFTHNGDNERTASEEAKRAYGDPASYIKYADGDVEVNWYDFEHRAYGFADKSLWNCLKQSIKRYANRGSRFLEVADIGCGPGTWLIRLADTFGKNGRFVRGVGIDISPEMVEFARVQWNKYKRYHPQTTAELTFEVGDASLPLRFETRKFDLTLSLYTVLNHINAEKVPFAIEEMLRVTRGCNVTTVRSKGGIRTAYIDSMDEVSNWHHEGDWLIFKHATKGDFRIPSHLFSFNELNGLFAKSGEIVEQFGLDTFMSRLTGNRASRETLPCDHLLLKEIARIERQLAHRPQFADVSNHLAIVTVPHLDGGSENH
ncbi:MAG TPA: class I SAM-dependent methyltransferase [Tepidisphaeraceae bacterium]|jgi:SAM-dependent methyltransferase